MRDARCEMRDARCEMRDARCEQYYSGNSKSKPQKPWVLCLHGTFAPEVIFLNSRLKPLLQVILITHCRRRFNAKKANLYSGIKQPYLLSCTSSYLAFRKSLPITHSREINFTPTLNRRRYACMARLRSNLY